MKKWHLFKEYFMLNSGEKRLEYMALFCTNEDGSYHKHIDIVYNETAYNLVKDIDDNSYFTFFYKLDKISNVLNELDFVKKIEMIKDIPEDATRQKHIIDVHSEGINGDIMFILADNKYVININADKDLFVGYEKIEQNIYFYKNVNLVFYENQESIDFLHRYDLCFFKSYKILSDFLNDNISDVVNFNILLTFMIMLTKYEKIKFYYFGKTTVIEKKEHLYNLKINFFKLGIRVPINQLEYTLFDYFGEYSKFVLMQIAEYEKNRRQNKKDIKKLNNIVELLAEKINDENLFKDLLYSSVA